MQVDKRKYTIARLTMPEGQQVGEFWGPNQARLVAALPVGPTQTPEGYQADGVVLVFEHSEEDSRGGPVEQPEQDIG